MGQVLRVQDIAWGHILALKVVFRSWALGRMPCSSSSRSFADDAAAPPELLGVFDYGNWPLGEPLLHDGGGRRAWPGRAAALRPTSRGAVALTQLLLALGYSTSRAWCTATSSGQRARAPGRHRQLMDFGLTEYAGRLRRPARHPAYMAPEMIKRGPMDQRADLYAVGCLAYELLTGQPPFGASGPATWCARTCRRPRPP